MTTTTKRRRPLAEVPGAEARDIRPADLEDACRRLAGQISLAEAEKAASLAFHQALYDEEGRCWEAATERWEAATERKEKP